MIKSKVTSIRFVSPSLCLWKAYTIVCSAMFLILAQFLICIPPSGASSVTLFPTPNPTCTDGTITEKNTFASVVLTGTATSCARLRGGSYKCTLQVWRVMKGSNLVMDILKGDRNIKAALPSKTYAEVYGMGNSAYCDSTVSDHDTRIFFLTRTADRLVLAASLLHITLKHLENTQNVIDGIAITERAPKPKNPCLDIICGYGAKCSLVDDVAKCECPHQTCDNEIVSPVCGSNGVTYSNICRLRAAQCNTQRRIRVAKETMCDVEETSGDFDEVSGDNVCNCHFGATCDDTSDDEDKSCACNFNCSSTSANLGPVCGSDVQTYANKCELLRAQCVMQRRLYVIKNETCNHDVKPQDKCFCNEYGSYTSTCDAVTRQCPCKPGVGGTLCDRCVPGYWNFRALAEKLISGCMECHCHEHGSVRSDCDQMTGACQCKPGITTGLKCTDCINDNSWVTSSMCDTTELESSGCGIGDDDDCENDESGSGDKDNINSHHKELTTIAFISTTNELKEATARSIKTLIGTAKFFKHEGLDLIYTSDLGVPMSELFKEYSAIIDTLVMKAANQSSLRGRIYSVTPTSFAKAKWYWTTGVRVAFNLEVDAKLLPEEVQLNLNDAYDIDNQYEIESRYP